MYDIRLLRGRLCIFWAVVECVCVWGGDFFDKLQRILILKKSFFGMRRGVGGGGGGGGGCEW